MTMTTARTGWLLLFAVLMAAGLLFCMVFFVRLTLLCTRRILLRRQLLPSECW